MTNQHRLPFHLSLGLLRPWFLIVALSLGLAPVLRAATAAIRFTPSTKTVRIYDFIEVRVDVARPPAGNPFTDAAVIGEFTDESGARRQADGFCDSEDGRVFRIRFLPTRPGRHVYAVTYRGGGVEQTHRGQFVARKNDSPGLLRVDPQHPWHFIFEGSGEHYFYNGTTAYWLLGWRDDKVIRAAIDRLAKLKVNRVRVALNGRTTGGDRWKEPDVKSNAEFQFRLEPWPAVRAADIGNPGYDVTRFNVEFFRKCERMLAHARKRGMVVSLIFHLDGRDTGVDPFGKANMGGPDEQRYFRYVIARLGAFDNVMWDVTNEWHLFRDEAWVEKMGALVKASDPYGHLTSVHGKETFPFRKSPWVDYAMFQSWDEHGAYDFMLKNRREQAATGRPMPQVNEEYGYEDHYPFPWGEGRRWPARVADDRRRLAWEMTMAGGYQTTGERANVPGYGGWITGHGNKEMVMLKGYAVMREFFEGIEWWKLEPAPDRVVNGHAHCLAQPGVRYLAYLPKGGSVTLKLALGRHRASWFNPRTGKSTKLPPVESETWTSPSAPDAEDWALLLQALK